MQSGENHSVCVDNQGWGDSYAHLSIHCYYNTWVPSRYTCMAILQVQQL